MARLAPYFQKIVSYPPTWGVVGILLLFESTIVLWFQPGPLLIPAITFLGIACFGLWVVFLLRSPAFLTEISRREFEKRLEGSFADFARVARDCWRVADRIKKEFGTEGFSGDVDDALAKLVKFADSHVKLHTLYQRFGDEEQKREMRQKIQKQVEHVEETRKSLLRLGGNIVLLEADTLSKDEISAELRTINAGLEDAIREMED